MGPKVYIVLQGQVFFPGPRREEIGWFFGRNRVNAEWRALEADG